MNAPLLAKELLEHRRNRRFVVVAALMIALVAVAALDGWNRAHAAARHRAAAVESDREVWVEQGENNPHGAAHFARYAFRPMPPLGAFDSGVSDYAGAAVWMEAHYQNPAALRRAEDVGARAPFPALDPAWTIRVIGSLALVVLLFGAVAGERESGTLRALFAYGVRPVSIVGSKAAAALAVIVALAVLAFVVALLPGMFGGASLDASRVVLLVGTYVLGLVAFAFAAIALSATASTRGAAMATVGAFWLVVALVVPMVAAQVGAALSPTPDERALNRAILDEAHARFWAGNARKPAIEAYAAKVAKRHGAASFDGLGFDRAGLELQAHEEFANAVYDRLYGELYTAQRGQDQVMRAAAALSPLLAVQRVSAGLAGTDLFAQLAFVRASEAHRRRIVEQLNRHMMEEAGGEGFAYMADRSLWEQIPDFDGTPPRTGAVLRRYWPELAMLALWVVVALVVARWLTVRAARPRAA